MMHIILNLKIQVSMNMSIVIKPWHFVPMKLNAFTVFRIGRIIEKHYHGQLIEHISSNFCLVIKYVKQLQNVVMF